MDVPNREEVTGSWRKLHNEELHYLNSLTKLRTMRWVGHVARMGEIRNACKIPVWKVEGREAVIAQLV
jgi:hypothetical protein